ncbi:hypothetical protein BLNAU_20173 [Blattamonas nauphoetae]|uniref:Uncharacterized protein n=1 Tax=Blattamonas nauphoetae TaxID=2049346 RepID=A0ABQ9WZY6_9EUKA|nr:hypothetical protein BLNAU_20173 [Blattamonas nauphoetae]
MSTLTIVSSVEGWTMPDDAGDTVSLKCCASSFASLSSVGSVLEKDQQIVAALVNIIPSSENARSPRDPPHMTAEGSRFRVHPNSHLQSPPAHTHPAQQPPIQLLASSPYRTLSDTVHPHWNSSHHNMHVTVNVISRRTPLCENSDRGWFLHLHPRLCLS